MTTEGGKRVYSVSVYCDATSHHTKRVKVITFLGTHEATFTGYTERIVWHHVEPVGRRVRHENNKFNARHGAGGSEPIRRGREYSHAWLEHMEAAGLQVTLEGVDHEGVREHKVVVHVDEEGKPGRASEATSPTFKMGCELCGHNPQASQATISPLLDGLISAGHAEVNLLTVEAWLKRPQGSAGSA